MQFNVLFEELSRSTEMIRALLAGISPAESHLRPAPDSWSVLEVVCHLHDEEREDFREHLDFVLHRRREQWLTIDPEAWVSERNYSAQDFAAVQDRFFAERAQSLAWLKELRGADWDIRYTSEHGSMAAGEILAAWVAHDNLHLRQLVELRRKRIEAISAPYDVQCAGEW